MTVCYQTLSGKTSLLNKNCIVVNPDAEITFTRVSDSHTVSVSVGCEECVQWWISWTYNNSLLPTQPVFDNIVGVTVTNDTYNYVPESADVPAWTGMGDVVFDFELLQAPNIIDSSRDIGELNELQPFGTLKINCFDRYNNIVDQALIPFNSEVWFNIAPIVPCTVKVSSETDLTVPLPSTKMIVPITVIAGGTGVTMEPAGDWYFITDNPVTLTPITSTPEEVSETQENPDAQAVPAMYLWYLVVEENTSSSAEPREGAVTFSVCDGKFTDVLTFTQSSIEDAACTMTGTDSVNITVSQNKFDSIVLENLYLTFSGEWQLATPESYFDLRMEGGQTVCEPNTTYEAGTYQLYLRLYPSMIPRSSWVAIDENDNYRATGVIVFSCVADPRITHSVMVLVEGIGITLPSDSDSTEESTIIVIDGGTVLEGFRSGLPTNLLAFTENDFTVGGHDGEFDSLLPSGSRSEEVCAVFVIYTINCDIKLSAGFPANFKQLDYEVTANLSFGIIEGFSYEIETIPHLDGYPRLSTYGSTKPFDTHLVMVYGRPFTAGQGGTRKQFIQIEATLASGEVKKYLIHVTQKDYLECFDGATELQTSSLLFHEVLDRVYEGGIQTGVTASNLPLNYVYLDSFRVTFVVDWISDIKLTAENTTSKSLGVTFTVAANPLSVDRFCSIVLMYGSGATAAAQYGRIDICQKGFDDTYHCTRLMTSGGNSMWNESLDVIFNNIGQTQELKMLLNPDCSYPITGWWIWLQLNDDVIIGESNNGRKIDSRIEHVIDVTDPNIYPFGISGTSVTVEDYDPIAAEDGVSWCMTKTICKIRGYRSTELLFKLLHLPPMNIASTNVFAQGEYGYVESGGNRVSVGSFVFRLRQQGVGILGCSAVQRPSLDPDALVWQFGATFQNGFFPIGSGVGTKAFLCVLNPGSTSSGTTYIYRVTASDPNGDDWFSAAIVSLDNGQFALQTTIKSGAGDRTSARTGCVLLYGTKYEYGAAVETGIIRSFPVYEIKSANIYAAHSCIAFKLGSQFYNHFTVENEGYDSANIPLFAYSTKPFNIAATANNSVVEATVIHTPANEWMLSLHATEPVDSSVTIMVYLLDPATPADNNFGQAIVETATLVILQGMEVGSSDNPGSSPPPSAQGTTYNTTAAAVQDEAVAAHAALNNPVEEVGLEPV
jgi:hypothetical protein